MAPYHHGVVPQVVDDGKGPPDVDGNCEYIEYAVMDRQQGVVLQLGGWAGSYRLPS
jgi:hypothetical protein